MEIRMRDRLHRQKNKTCWSIVSNTLSHLTPKKLFIFCLLVSAQAVAASEMRPLNFFRGNRDVGTWDKKSCIQAAPDCLLEVSTTGDGNFGVNQICDELQEYQRTSLVDQMRKERFIGQTLCDGVITSSKTHKDGSVSVDKIDFNTPASTYKTSQSFSVPQKHVESSISKPECPAPIAAECPPSPECSVPKVAECPPPPKSDNPSQCRVAMWAVERQGGVVTQKNPHGFKYKLMGSSDDEVIDYSHKCSVVR